MQSQRVLFSALALLCAPAPALEVFLPLGRNVYQTNEWLEVAVIRADASKDGEVVLALDAKEARAIQDLDGRYPRRSYCTFAAPAGARTLHLKVDCRLLVPDDYALAVWTSDEKEIALPMLPIRIVSHVRRTTFKLINWGRAKGNEQLIEGEENLGFNLFYGHYADDRDANLMRAGLDFMGCCVMSGGHQMDLRPECDWSDPYVIRGGTRRAVRSAFLGRTRPNVIGVHFYDEPGLTWHKDPATGQMTPHGVPSQVRSFESAFGRPWPDYREVDPAKPESAAAWAHWARWKLGFIDAAWQDAQHGVALVRPDYICATQSQYGFSAFADGYYFNVARCLPVVSGHGGYHDWGPGYFNPVMTLELARARDLAKPCWYLPTWYGNTTNDVFRLEQYLCFQTNIQGMISPPDLEPATNPSARQGIVESNLLMARLGTIFAAMPVTRPPVALLYSLSNNIHAQTRDMTYNYAHSGGHGANLPFMYLAGKLLGQQFMAVLDEDIVDGTLAACHKAVILTSIDYLDPAVREALRMFSLRGGLVLKTHDTPIDIEGSVDLGVVPGFPDAARIEALKKEGKAEEATTLMRMRQMLAGARTLADALAPHLAKRGIAPPVKCDEPGIVITRQAAGDVEYFFLVNAAHDSAGDPMLGLRAAEARVAFPEGDAPLYDAIAGRRMHEFSVDRGELAATLRFGPGQMRVLARTAFPLRSVFVGPPTIVRSAAPGRAPLALECHVTVFDDRQLPVDAAIPLRIIVTDPAGRQRHDIYRATAHGVFALSLPIAASACAGVWSVDARELLSGLACTAESAYVPEPLLERTTVLGAGAVERALVFEGDRAHIARFTRTFGDVTIVVGASEFDAKAGERLAASLKPWDVACKIVAATEVDRPRVLSAEEARTWVGLTYAGSGQIKAGDGNSPALVGFAVRGPVILIGNPGDNPLIAHLAKEGFLPYTPAPAKLPGPGRGMLAWQRDGIGPGQESITLIAYDAEGMSEAVGSCYEAAAAIDPLVPLAPPRDRFVERAKKLKEPTPFGILWDVEAPDRIDALRFEHGLLTVVSHDGTVLALREGTTAETRVETNLAKLVADLAPPSDPALFADAASVLGPARLVKLAAVHAGATWVACWGGTLYAFDEKWQERLCTRFEQDITAIAPAGECLAVGCADGKVFGIKL